MKKKQKIRLSLDESVQSNGITNTTSDIPTEPVVEDTSLVATPENYIPIQTFDKVKSQQETEKERLSGQGISGFETLKANFNYDNPLAKANPFYYPEELSLDITDDPNFNPFDSIDGYEDYAESFISATNERQSDRIKYSIDEERRNKDIMDNSGGLVSFISSMAAGTVSPINLLPIGAAYKSISAGSSMLKSGLVTAATNATSQALEEVILQGQQYTRTFGEGALNVTASTLLGGVLGTAAGAISKAKYGQLGKQLESDLTIPKEGTNYLGGDKVSISKADLEADTSVFKSLSAASTNTSAKIKSAFGVEKLVPTPGMRLTTSNNIESRRSVQQLIDTGLVYEDNALGIASPTPVSTLVESFRNTDISQYSYKTNDLFSKYVNSQKNIPINERFPLTDNLGIPIKNNILTKEKFNEEIMRAAYTGQHGVKEVAEAAKEFKRILNRWRDENIAVGNLPESAIRPDYIPHYYSREKIFADPDAFIGAVETEIRSLNPNKALDPSEVNEIAADLMQKILHGDPNTPVARQMVIPKNRGSLKERTLDLPNDVAFNFIETDADKVLKRYLDHMIPDAVLKQISGDVDGTGFKLRISEQYRKDLSLLNRESAKTAEGRNVLLKELEDKRVKDLEQPEANKKIIEEQYRSDKNFIEMSTPQEVIARRKAVQTLDARYESNINKAYSQLFKKAEKSLSKKLSAKNLGLSKSQKVKLFYSQLADLSEKIKNKDDSLIRGKFAQKIEKIKRSHAESVKNVTDSKTAKQRAIEREIASKDAQIKSLDKENSSYETRLQEITSAYETKVALLNASASVKEVKVLSKKYDQDIIDIDTLVSMIKNTGNVTSNNILSKGIARDIITTAKTINYATNLGQVSISSITDIGTIAAVHGMSKAFGATFAGLIRGMTRTLSPQSSSGKFSADVVGELKNMGFVVERILQNRYKSLNDMTDQYTTDLGRKFNTGLSNIASKASLINYTYDALRCVGVTAAQNRILSNKLTPKEITILASYGLDKQMVLRIQSQYKKYGSQKNGSFLLGIDQWDDKQASVMMQLGLQRMVDNTVLNPKYEVPNFFHTEIGGLMGQFKKWGIAATQRILVSGVQRRDSEVMQGMVALTGLGMFSAMIKDYIRNGEVKERSTDEWIRIGIDRSGVLGYLPDLYNYANELTLGAIGQGFGLEDKDQYHSVEKTLKTLSPTISLGSNIVKALPIFWSDKKTSAQTYALRSIMPLQNSLLLSKGFDFIENRFRDAYGIKPRGQSTKTAINY